jgi:hypothetical protein
MSSVPFSPFLDSSPPSSLSLSLSLSLHMHLLLERFDLIRCNAMQCEPMRTDVMYEDVGVLFFFFFLVVLYVVLPSFGLLFCAVCALWTRVWSRG